jgi:PhoPQ-activated pathogenicity-related protein
VIESSENVSNMKVITPAKQNSHTFRKLLPRIFIGADGFETERPDEQRAGYLEDCVLPKFGRIATVQIGAQSEAANYRDLRALVDSFSRDILKKNSYEKVFLDEFFWEEDDIFKYELINTDESSDQMTTYEYNMTSLQWLDDTVTDRPVWTHTVYLIVPKEVKDAAAMFLQVTWGDNWIQPQTRASHSDDLVRTQNFAINTGIVSGVIKHVPNQPIRFSDDTSDDELIYGTGDGTYDGRYEDGILAKTWDMFVKNFDATGKSDFNLLVHPSMGKAAVRALDLIAEETFVHTGRYPFKAGVVGASKRGWTCWLAAAADFERIKLNVRYFFTA